jgi:hypothetical protein
VNIRLRVLPFEKRRGYNMILLRRLSITYFAASGLRVPHLGI